MLFQKEAPMGGGAKSAEDPQTQVLTPKLTPKFPPGGAAARSPVLVIRVEDIRLDLRGSHVTCSRI